MKIGILTLPIAENYGGILQALALYRFLDSQGHDVTLIYKKNIHNSNVKLWKKVLKKILLSIPFHDFKNLKLNKKTYQQRDERIILHKHFIDNEISKISKNLYTKNDLETFAKEEAFDAIIVGSDQVWRKQYMGGIFYKNYFLDFVDARATKKIAFSASFGKNIWEGKDDSKDIAKCLNDFSAISTRELSGVSVCKNIFGIDNVKHTLDPTMLMGREFYLDIISRYDTSSITNGGLLTYVLDEADEKKDIIEYVQKELNINKINHIKGFNYRDATYTVPQWIALFSNADMIVTDSFHGMVFAIIFEKNFFVIGNHNRGLDRFISLLSLLNLEDKLVFDVKDLEDKIKENIDYDRVHEIIGYNKNDSLNFLMESLNDK